MNLRNPLDVGPSGLFREAMNVALETPEVDAVVAFPVESLCKLRGLVLGILLLQFLNLMRIVTLFWVGSYFPSVFKTAHEVVWPGILITMTVVAWVVWVRWETQPPRSPEHAA